MAGRPRPPRATESTSTSSRIAHVRWGTLATVPQTVASAWSPADAARAMPMGEAAYVLAWRAPPAANATVSTAAAHANGRSVTSCRRVAATYASSPAVAAPAAPAHVHTLTSGHAVATPMPTASAAASARTGRVVRRRGGGGGASGMAGPAYGRTSRGSTRWGPGVRCQ